MVAIKACVLPCCSGFLATGFNKSHLAITIFVVTVYHFAYTYHTNLWTITSQFQPSPANVSFCVPLHITMCAPCYPATISLSSLLITHTVVAATSALPTPSKGAEPKAKTHFKVNVAGIVIVAIVGSIFLCCCGCMCAPCLEECLWHWRGRLRRWNNEFYVWRVRVKLRLGGWLKKFRVVNGVAGTWLGEFGKRIRNGFAVVLKGRRSRKRFVAQQDVHPQRSGGKTAGVCLSLMGAEVSTTPPWREHSDEEWDRYSC